MSITRTRSGSALVVAALAVATVLAACSFDNGLPAAVRTLLRAHGIDVEVVSAEASLRSRGGVVEIRHDPAIEARIARALSLTPLSSDDPGYARVAAHLPGATGALWGASGRPPVLRLADGGQLEYLYLVTTTDLRCFIVAEFAYG